MASSASLASPVPRTRRRSAAGWMARHSGYLFVVPMLVYTLALTIYPIAVNLQMSVYDVKHAVFVLVGDKAKIEAGLQKAGISKIEVVEAQ